MLDGPHAVNFVPGIKGLAARGIRGYGEVMNLHTANEQVAAARGHALALAASEMTVLVVTGSDRLSWLNGMLTCDLAAAKPGDVAYGLAVTVKGRILSDVIVIVDPERVLLSVERAAVDRLRASFDRHLMMEDAVVGGAPELGTWFVHGPRAAEVLAAARRGHASGGSFDRTGLGGAVICAPTPFEPHVERAVASVGGMMGDRAGWDTLRVERGVAAFGVDFGEETYPQEAGLEKTAVSFAKGCYLGQEVVCMLEMRGHVKRKLVSLVMSPGAEVPPPGAAILDAAGTPVGQITSAALSPTRGRPMALAMVKYASASLGGAVNVGSSAAEIIDPTRPGP